MKIISRKEAREEGLKKFYTGITCIHGHLSERWVSTGGCCECIKAATKKLRKDPRYREAEQNRERERYHDPSTGRRDRQLALHKKRWREDPAVRERNKIKMRERVGDPEWLDYRRSYSKEWYKNPDNAISMLMKRMVYRVISSHEKSSSTSEELGYSRCELMTHIEKQFTKGMTWDNYGEWHIDHIIPVSAMIKNGVKDPRVVNALSNLRPMWASENMAKKDKIETLL